LVTWSDVYASDIGARAELFYAFLGLAFGLYVASGDERTTHIFGGEVDERIRLELRRKFGRGARYCREVRLANA
jgi:hypothetical protein